MTSAERKESKKQWLRDNREKARASSKLWNEKNKEKKKAYDIEWHKNHKRKPNKVSKKLYTSAYRKVYRATYRARRRNAVGVFTKTQWESLCRKHKWRCLCCGKKKKLTADHIIPLSKGGSNYITNIQPLCHSCNSKKHDKTIDYRRKKCMAMDSAVSQTSASSTSKSPATTTNRKPQQNSQQRSRANTGRTSGKGESRNEKRARWAKKSRPAANLVVKRGPVREYVSACCSALATKPTAGAKESVKDPESGKTKDKAKGLGKWRCTTCRKVTKVTPRKPEPPMANLSTRSPFPGPLTTPVLNIPPAPEGAVSQEIVGGPIA